MPSSNFVAVSMLSFIAVASFFQKEDQLARPPTVKPLPSDLWIQEENPSSNVPQMIKDDQVCRWEFFQRSTSISQLTS